MLLIPAIDLKGGQCVRLRQGRMNDATVFSDDPAAVAKRWADEGAERIHVVDLDGAFKGSPVNLKVVEEIVAAVDVPVQIGGGIRDEETVQRYLNSGVQYVIIGTKAVNTPHFLHDLCLEFPRHIIVSLDAKDGRVALNGWAKVTSHDVVETAVHCERDGVEAIIYTDISRDGMMQGFNAESTSALARALKTPVLASGGVSSLDDIRRLKEIENDGVAGAVIGRALYEGGLDFKEAVRLAKG
ncbi:1-(5-phosphoribosyl)-5-[(5-phosphoribosylamino)methylideneamino]imidazole-4-carboxamide isomerase [Solimonas flava]|uniref:1-(5-phosphoribosyl)-5-[(5- phosphoribosylamino)methylideneamino]imidazole-4- carboxamide isomerase n=1 Tax=Solimonas flava TaxID=415849 RepID=UPI0004216CA7|nr:1-(5-phosphoribosyl)-5-[(5-phosphoribosylamino)methylideneamino]imidazole-4-carboxamide isomerase [Solimonas flava]